MDDIQIQQEWNTFVSLLQRTKREGVDNIINWLGTTDFKTAPASTKYHNAFRGGLLNHSLNVYNHMYDLNNLLEFFELPEDTVIITSLLHDVCKVDFYEESTRNVKNDQGQWIQVPFYTVNEQRAWGHAQKSVIELQKHGLKLNDVEITMILNHMGFSETDNNNRVSTSFGQCPQSIVLYFADMMATYLTESYNLPTRFLDNLKGKNINECLYLMKHKDIIKIDNMEYKLAPDNAIVDNRTIIEIPKVENGNVIKYKVYAPYKDGLPF